MATIVTRAVKGSALSHTEMDANFNNLNTDKAELSGSTFTGTVNLTSTFQISGIAVTSTAAELNSLDGITSTVSELNILDGVTSTAAELNILDGVTSTTVELNYVDGVTSAIQTQLNTITSSNWVTAARIAENAVGTSEIAANAVAAEYAGTALGAVGSIAFLAHATINTTVTAGSTYAGSALRYSGIGHRITDSLSELGGPFGATPSGTWRALGTINPNTAAYALTVFLRIS